MIEEMDHVTMLESKHYKAYKDNHTEWIYLDPIEENQPYRYVLIFLHGMNEDANKYFDMFNDWEKH